MMASDKKGQGKMARYIKEIELGIAPEKVEEILGDFLQENEFYRTTWKGEACYAADVSIVKEVKFLKYRYEEGVLHFEAWLRDGASKEQGLTGLASITLKKPYLDVVISLLGRCIQEAPQARDKKDIILQPEKKQSSVYAVLLLVILVLFWALMRSVR